MGPVGLVGLFRLLVRLLSLARLVLHRLGLLLGGLLGGGRGCVGGSCGCCGGGVVLALLCLVDVVEARLLLVQPLAVLG